MFKTLAQKYQTWRNYRKTIDELSQLDNQTLEDIGLARRDIPRVAHQTIYG